jgi:hypothetical protein
VCCFDIKDLIANDGTSFLPMLIVKSTVQMDSEFYFPDVDGQGAESVFEVKPEDF